MVETKQLSHIHELIDGRETGADIKDTSDQNLHWHDVEGDKTSTDAYGDEHVHIFQDVETLGPININDENEGFEMEEINSDEDEEPTNEKNVEYKHIGGQILEVKQEEVNGVRIGTVKGYIATWSLDRGNDRFAKGAFSNSLNELRAKNRPIRLKDSHWQTIGGFPIDRVFEDDKGLFGVGHINLEVQKGKEAFSLAKQGILSDFSVGFSVNKDEMDGDIRIIHEAIIWEGSLVDEPMNPDANVTEVKNIVPFQDLEIAERNQCWDSSAALSRIREFTGSDEAPSANYKNAFIWFDSKESTRFGAYKLPIADIIDGRMTVVPKAIFAAADLIRGAHDVNTKAIRHIERYYAKMNLESPFSDSNKQYFVSSDVIKWTPRKIEKYLKSSGGMSLNACRIIASRMTKGETHDKIIDKSNKVDYNRIKTVLKGTSPSLNDVLSGLKAIR